MLPDVDAVHLPASDDGVRRPGSRIPVALALAEGQVPHEAGHGAMVHVEVRGAVVEARVVVVEEPLPAVEARSPDAGGGRFAVGALRPGVGEGGEERAAMMLDLGVDAVVLRSAAPGAVDVHAEVGIGLAAGHGGVGRRVFESLGDVDPHQQVVALAPHVVQLGHGALRDLPLHAERPLIDVGVPGLRGHAHGEKGVGGRSGHTLLGEAREQVVGGLVRCRLTHRL